MATIYHTPEGLPFVDVDGEPIVLGALAPDPVFSAAPDFVTAFPVLPQNQWEETSLRAAHIPVRNQRNFGSCGGQSTVGALMTAREIRSLKKHILSATFIYGHCNGGRDGGCRVVDAVMTAKNVGACLDTEVPWNMIYKNQFPQQSFQTAKRFRALDVYKINSYEELCTALTLGFPCVSGIAVGNNFTRGQLRDDGLAPLPDSIVGGHAMYHVGLKRLGNLWCLDTQNSWGTQWGINGFCYLQKGHFNPGYGFGFDVYAIASVIDDPEDKGDDLVPIVMAAMDDRVGSLMPNDLDDDHLFDDSEDAHPEE